MTLHTFQMHLQQNVGNFECSIYSVKKGKVRCMKCFSLFIYCSFRMASISLVSLNLCVNTMAAFCAAFVKRLDEVTDTDSSVFFSKI